MTWVRSSGAHSCMSAHTGAPRATAKAVGIARASLATTTSNSRPPTRRIVSRAAGAASSHARSLRRASPATPAGVCGRDGAPSWILR